MTVADYVLAGLLILGCLGFALYGFARSLFANEMTDRPSAAADVEKAGLFQAILGVSAAAYFVGVIVTSDWGWLS